MLSRPLRPTSALRRSLPVAFVVLLAAGWASTRQDVAFDPVLVGDEKLAFTWDLDWPPMPDDVAFGPTHGAVAVDSAGRIYVTTDSEHAVLVFAPTGELESTFGKELRGGLHGMCIVTEGEDEFLYLAHLGRHEVIKTTLKGEIVWTLGFPEEAGAYANAGEFKPTGVAVGPDGAIYVADGYGKSLVHQFDAKRNYVRTWGGHGEAPGKMRTPHGIYLDPRGETPTLIVSDRENHRLQHFDLEGKLLGVTEGMLRRPCNVYAHGEELVVADLAGRVTVLDGKNELVVHLGDNPEEALRANFGVAPDGWRPGFFFAPHGAAWDAAGNLYVQDWNRWGRLTKLARVSRDGK